VPSPRRALTLHDVEQTVVRQLGGEPCERDGLGIELEWLTRCGRNGDRLNEAGVAALRAHLGDLPRGSRLTMEPGGQLELSSRCRTQLDDVLEDAAADLLALDRACVELDIDLVALGADPDRTPERTRQSPRYAAMEAYFDRQGSAGRTMMCNTAAIQVNIGPGDDVARRWRAANLIGPVLLASFANSPFAHSEPSGWASTRFHAWWTLDPTRSAPVPLDGDPGDRWLEYVLRSEVMLVRLADDHYQGLAEPMTFGRWLAEGHELGWPDADDLAYHLTTLFPPVRPKGWLELRMIDALPTPFWMAAMSVATALITDPDAARRAEAACAEDASGRWIEAARHGLGDDGLRRAAVACFEAALDALPRDTAGYDVVAAYLERWVARGRCPADDRLDRWRRDGALVPTRESPVRYADELAGLHLGGSA
jgi:glutamate--cysteine ligase